MADGIFDFGQHCASFASLFCRAFSFLFLFAHALPIQRFSNAFEKRRRFHRCIGRPLYSASASLLMSYSRGA